ncbi:MAG: hypothetical protein EA393_12595 [Bacteroidetes bacterium]|nr:MAG: hypothetical protein EA393_12595 [Bacteroidota bacterium]
MIKILILSYHYPPDNIIAARRAEAYARHLHKFGIYPTIITDRFEKVWDKQGNWAGYKNHDIFEKPIIKEYDSHRVIRMPRIVTPLQRFQKIMERIPLLSPLFTFFMNLLGHFDMHLLAHNTNYKNYLRAHLKNHKYDLVVTLFSPYFPVRIAYTLHKEFKIPYVCDFRDHYDNKLLNPFYKPPFFRRITNKLKQNHIKTWLAKSGFLTAVSTTIADSLSKLSGVKGFEITNGFEPSYYQNNYNETFNKFTISHVGTFYPEQDISVLINGVATFIKENEAEDFRLKFIGLKLMNQEQQDFIKQRIDSKYLELQGRVDYNQALSIMQKSHILFYPAWTLIKGIYSGKIFEYLGARRPILVSPGNKDLVEKLIGETSSGSIANTPQEVCTFITEKYNEWKQTGRVSYNGIEEEIMKYTRENQVKKMAELIHNFLPAKSNR